MGHEIAHAIARHGNERMSQGMAVQGAGMTLQVLGSPETGMPATCSCSPIGIGSQLGMLAYSRKHESEADKMGLVFMAMAGYDPRGGAEVLGAHERPRRAPSHRSCSARTPATRRGSMTLRRTCRRL
jgi:predicted Zn-dependent protease